jgi:hypothetical protein
MFNSVINVCELREIEISGGQYTRTNNQAVPTLEKLDRFLISREWELLFPLTTVHKLIREISDHNPIILDTMEGREKQAREFRFEKRWLKEEDFITRVARIWSQPVRAKDSLAFFQQKLKNVKKVLKGWGANIIGRDAKKKKDLSQELAEMEIMEESVTLSIDQKIRNIFRRNCWQFMNMKKSSGDREEENNGCSKETTILNFFTGVLMARRGKERCFPFKMVMR